MKMTVREVLVNIKNFDMWEYASYKLSQDEAAVVIEALEEKARKEDKYAGKRKKKAEQG